MSLKIFAAGLETLFDIFDLYCLLVSSCRQVLRSSKWQFPDESLLDLAGLFEGGMVSNFIAQGIRTPAELTRVIVCNTSLPRVVRITRQSRRELLLTTCFFFFRPCGLVQGRHESN